MHGSLWRTSFWGFACSRARASAWRNSETVCKSSPAMDPRFLHPDDSSDLIESSFRFFAISGRRSSVQNQRVLVTGGAGFIGSELVRQLAGRGCGVRVVDNLVNGRRENLDGVLSENVELVVADVRDAKSMTSLVLDVEIVFHLACLGVRHSIHSPLENHEVN